MTDRERKKREEREAMTAGERLFCFLSALSLLLVFCFPDESISAMSEGMRLCISVVVPSLFPFMVLSDALVSSGGARLISLPLRRPLRALFGLSEDGASALVPGMLCGFPVGARCALSLYSSGRLSRGETEHLLCFCNGPSAAFLINAVGVSLFSSRSFGLLLYASQMLSSILVGVMLRPYFAGRHRGYTCVENSPCSRAEKRSVCMRISGAVTGAAESVISICAFVIFFSSLTGVLRALLERSGLGGAPSAVLLGFFEMTGGVSAASALPLPQSVFLTAAVVGWSGLSVHFQLVALCKEQRLSFAPYFVSKLISAALCACFVGVGILALGESLELSATASPSVLLAPPQHPAELLSLAVLALGVAGKRRNPKTRPLIEKAGG